MRVIIVGGGIAGATLALAISALSRGNIPVSLIESKLPNQQHSGFDARSIALAYGTCQHLATIGIWPALVDYVTPITHVHVSDRGHAGFVNIAAKDHHISELGNVIELHDAGSILFALLNIAAGVTLYCPTKVESILRTQQQVSVTLNTGESLHGTLLVAADGSHSAISRACNMQWQEDDYQQVAIIANLKTEQDPQGRAFERFTEFGPLALLPMSQGRSSLVWCHNRQYADEIALWDDDSFLNKLQIAFGWRLGRIAQVGARNYYPLVLRKSMRQVSHRVALVGNASQTLHPIAGQGFNLAMRDVMQLAQSVTQAALRGEDIGAFSVLNQYQQSRHLDRDKTVAMTDGLVRLFTNSCAPLVVGRNVGLMAMDMLAPARHLLTRQTLGWATPTR